MHNDVPPLMDLSPVSASPRTSQVRSSTPQSGFTQKQGSASLSFHGPACLCTAACMCIIHSSVNSHTLALQCSAQLTLVVPSNCGNCDNASSSGTKAVATASQAAGQLTWQGECSRSGRYWRSMHGWLSCAKHLIKDSWSCANLASVCCRIFRMRNTPCFLPLWRRHTFWMWAAAASSRGSLLSIFLVMYPLHSV